MKSSIRTIFKISLPFSLFLGLASATQAQVTYYSPGSVGRPIASFSVAGNGDDALALFGMVTDLHSNGETTRVLGQFGSVSSDGRFFGSVYDTLSRPVYLDFDGTVKTAVLDPTSYTAQSGGVMAAMEGSFIQTRTSVDGETVMEIFQNGVKQPALNLSGTNSNQRSGITKNGNTIYDMVSGSGSRTIEVFNSQANRLAILSSEDGSGVLQQGRGEGNIVINVNDLVANDQIVFGWENALTGGKGSGIYDILTGQVTDVADNGIRTLRMNTSGDMLGIKSKKVHIDGYGAGGGGVFVDAHEFWFFKNGEGWFNASEINGMAPVLGPYLLDVDLSEDGVIYGTLDASIRVNADISQAFRMAPVPEPSSMILLALGAGGFIAARRRKSRV